jgi:multiple sugar transport system permease protein
MNVNVFARFVPIIVLMIPLYVTFRRLDLLNSVWGVIIAETGFLLPYGVLILAPYFAALPQELDEAARIDGCSRFTAFLRVTLPLSTPALASYGAIVFIIAWNDLLTPLILNNRAEFMTLPVVIASLVGDVHVFFSLMMAICLVAMAPSVILVLLLQKFVVRGLAAGAVKG